MSAIHILKNTTQRAVIKVYNDSGASTQNITLASLLGSNETNVGTYKAHIRALYWGVKNSQDVTVGRYNGSSIEGETYLSGSGEVEYFGAGFSDNTYETLDLQVVFGGAGSVIIDVAKVSGYVSRVEDATYGAYDDPTRIGASTTMSGSPDKA